MSPGWHAGSLPSMRQIGKGKDRNLRDDSFAWVEGEVSADVNYQQEMEHNPERICQRICPKTDIFRKLCTSSGTSGICYYLYRVCTIEWTEGVFRMEELKLHARV